MNFIQLRLETGRYVYINMDLAKFMAPCKTGTAIHMGGDNEYVVLETPEQIFQKSLQEKSE